ncbi:MAG: hypothetical protein E7570_01680 [Ruminococcaceae bacterium]|nr:hypothetical protein [Oscillospiraceae bacterium]
MKTKESKIFLIGSIVLVLAQIFDISQKLAYTINYFKGVAFTFGNFVSFTWADTISIIISLAATAFIIFALLARNKIFAFVYFGVQMLSVLFTFIRSIVNIVIYRGTEYLTGYIIPNTLGGIQTILSTIAFAIIITTLVLFYIKTTRPEAFKKPAAKQPFINPVQQGVNVPEQSFK